MLNYIKNSLILSIVLLVLASCGGFDRKKAAINQPTNAQERVAKNVKEGRGLRFSTSMGKKGSGDFLFASSNALWRATLEKLDFIPLANGDYAGGVIITDWYGSIESNEEIKIAVRFLTNEIRSDALNVTIYKRECVTVNNCQTSKIENKTNNEIKASILKRATIISNEAKSKKEND